MRKIGKATWQDMLMMIGGFGFIPSLAFLMMEKATVPLATSVPTAIILMMFAVCLWTSKLRLAATSNAITAACWLAIAIMMH